MASDDTWAAYYKEVADIQGSREHDDRTEEENVETSTDGALEFLQDAGLGDIICHIEDGKEIDSYDSDITSLLTPKQAATLRKRVVTATETIRQRTGAQHHAKPRRDVREIFGLALGGANDVDHRPPSPIQPDHVVVRTSVSPVNSAARKPKKGGSTFSPIDNRRTPTPPPDYAMTDETVVNIGIGMVSIGVEEMICPTLKPMENAEIPSSHGRQTNNNSTRVVVGELGVTHLEDLGKKDRKTVNTLAYLELMSIFDEQRIEYARLKAKKKVKDHGVFGVPVQIVLDRDRKKNPNIEVPVFFQQIVQHLERKCLSEEGLLRVPGAQSRIKELKEEIDSQGKIHNVGYVWAHDAAGLLKLYLRDIPGSLLTLEHVNAFRQVSEMNDNESQLRALNQLVLVLPDVNRSMLQMLLSLLHKIVDDPDNRMTVENVAMIIAPNLFLIASAGDSHNKPTSMEDELKMAAATSMVVKLMIHYQQRLFTVPPTLIAQIRQKNDDAKKPAGSRLGILSRKEKVESTSRHSAPPSMSPHIAVTLDTISVDISVPLEKSTTAGDVLLLAARSPKHQRRKISGNNAETGSDIKSENTHLYEVGGNIGERRLDPNTNMLSLCQVNPNAKYVIRSKPV